LITLSLQCQSALRGVDEDAWFRRWLWLSSFFFCLMLGPALAWRASTGTALAAWFAGWLVSTVLVVALLVRVCGRPRWPRRMVRPLLYLGLPQGLALLLTQGHLRIDIVLLEAMRGSSTLGRYAVAAGFVELLSFGALACGVS